MPPEPTSNAQSKSALRNVGKIPRAFPDFSGFAKSHPSIGANIGEIQKLPSSGFFQEFQNATVYGDSGSEPHEVHGAIRDRYRQLGGPGGFLGFPTTDESRLADGLGRFNHFERGSIFWHPSTGAFEVHGQIRDKWAALGWERSWLGYPISDELALHDQDSGQCSVFQNGSIYWWPDVGARDLRGVIVHYTGLHCFAETKIDIDSTPKSDEPYATVGVVGPDNTKGTFRSRIYEDMNSGNGVFDVIEIYRGRPSGLGISVLLQEHSGGDTEASRKLIADAVEKGGPLLTSAATAIPLVGPVLGPLSTAAFQLFKRDIVEALNSFIEQTLGFADRPLGSDLITLTPKQMVVLATRPEGHAQFNSIPWKFETQLLERQDAAYKMYFNIFPL
jgi:hypothetical protein